MDAIGVNPLILIGLAAALAALVLLARGRRPRRIGMGGPKRRSGAVSRSRGGPDRAPRKAHGRHDPDWRTDSPKAPSSKPARTITETTSLHERLQALAERRGKGEAVDQGEALRIIATSREAAAAGPGILRFARLAILAWLGLWGFSAVMVVMNMADSGPDGEAFIALPFVAIPVALGIFGLRFLKRIERRMASKQTGKDLP